MKKHLFIPLAAIMLAMNSCNNSANQLAERNHERDSLTAIINQQEASINDFANSYIEIQQNLNTISEKGNTIERNMAGDTKYHGDLKKRINENIAEINALMKENKDKIAELNKRLKNSSHKNAKLEKLIASLNEQIKTKDEEIALLNVQLEALYADVEKLHGTVDMLTAKNSENTATIESQTQQMHRAYYVAGKPKELEEQKIISRKGGILGIGKRNIVNPQIDNSKFTQIDYTQTTAMKIESKNAQIITVHPSDSYVIEKQEDSSTIIIKDPEKFWSASKYLVVVK